MLVQGTDVDIAYGSSYIGFVNKKKNALYSVWGNDIPVHPNPNYFPETKYSFKLKHETQSFNNLYLDAGGHGYFSGGIIVTPTESMTNNKTYSFDNIELQPYGYGYYSNGITCPTGTININTHTYTFEGITL